MATAIDASIDLRHPLEPLAVEEIATTVGILRRDPQLGPHMRFVSISLQEPSKAEVLAFPSQGAIERQAFVILFDRETGGTYEAIVSLTRSEVTSWEHIPDVQP